MRTIERNATTRAGPRLTLLPLVLFAVGCGPACLVPWYADADGDGYGDRADLQETCEAPKGYVDNARDCDDRDPQIHPDRVDSCNGIDDDCDGTIDPEAREWHADIDEDGVGGRFTIVACAAPDGYTDSVGDCDDGNPTVYPGAVELCDGHDQDCDTLVDEGAGGGTLWYPDDDHDGWGTTQGARELCAPPESWVDRAGDCDDADYSRSPSAPEICNGQDDDCDGYTDIDDPSVDGVIYVYVDNDADAYGIGFPIRACVVNFGQTQVSGDCDDEDWDIHPGGDEICGGADEDCDGFVDLDDPSLALSSLLDGWADNDGDGLGDPDAPTVTCTFGGPVIGNALDCDDTDRWIGTDDWLVDGDGDGAGGGTVVAGEDCAPPVAGMVNVAAPQDCDDTDPDLHQGAPDPCGDGVDQDCSGVDPACSGPLDGILAIPSVGRTWIDGVSPGDGLGVVSTGADFDGDGFVDVLVGAPGADGAGAVQILGGPPPEGSAAWTARTRIVGPRDAGEFGAALVAVGDLSSDGLPDLLVGAPEAGGTGEAYLFAGYDGFVEPWLTVFGAAGDEVGAAVANVGDVDGTGGLEVLIGAPGREEAALVSVGTGSQAFTAARLRLQGSGRFGEQVACCTDLQAVGSTNLVIGAPDESGVAFAAGMVWIVDSLTDPGVWPVDFVEAAQFRGEGAAHLGRAIATGGDLDGDGLTDVVASAPNDGSGGQDAGKVYGFTVGDSGDAENVATWSVEGNFPGMQLAQTLVAGDLDADGADDVAMGADRVDVGGGDGGAVYVFHGPLVGNDSAAEADLVLFGPPASQAGASLSLGPIDVDPGLDLWIGMPGVEPGAAWLVPGGP